MSESNGCFIAVWAKTSVPSSGLQHACAVCCLRVPFHHMPRWWSGRHITYCVWEQRRLWRAQCLQVSDPWLIAEVLELGSRRPDLVDKPRGFPLPIYDCFDRVRLHGRLLHGRPDNTQWGLCADTDVSGLAGYTQKRLCNPLVPVTTYVTLHASPAATQSAANLIRTGASGAR